MSATLCLYILKGTSLNTLYAYVLIVWKKDFQTISTSLYNHFELKFISISFNLNTLTSILGQFNFNLQSSNISIKKNDSFKLVANTIFFYWQFNHKSTWQDGQFYKFTISNKTWISLDNIYEKKINILSNMKSIFDKLHS